MCFVLCVPWPWILFFQYPAFIQHFSFFYTATGTCEKNSLRGLTGSKLPPRGARSTARVSEKPMPHTRPSVISAQRRPASSIRLQVLSHMPSRATRGDAGAASRRRRTPIRIRINNKGFKATPAGSRMSVRTTPLVHMGVDERTQGAESHSEKASLINFQCGKTLSFRANHLKVQRVLLLLCISLIFVIFHCSVFCFTFLSF